MLHENNYDTLAAAIAAHPGTFGLRSVPGKTFRVSPAASYFSDVYGILLYTEILYPDGTWHSYAKGSPAELAREKIPAPK